MALKELSKGSGSRLHVLRRPELEYFYFKGMMNRRYRQRRYFDLTSRLATELRRRYH